jgi:hypothetical protein
MAGRAGLSPTSLAAVSSDSSLGAHGQTRNTSQHNCENEQIHYRTKAAFGFKYSRDSEYRDVNFFSLAHIHPTPGWDPSGRCRITAGQQNRKLMGLKGLSSR